MKTVVTPGAEPSWISTRQVGIRIQGGARYVMTAWVRARDVEGQAGWYIHVGNSEKPMLISPMLDAGGGTFDWKKVSTEFTAPAEADRADLGTVLRGTGVAWFDQVTLECLDPASIKAVAGPVELLDLKKVGAIAPWPADTNLRAEVKLVNFSREPAGPAQACLDLSTLEGWTHGPLDRSSLQVIQSRKAIPHTILGDRLLFPVEVPGRTEWTCYLDFKDEAPGAGDRRRGQTADLLRSNLVRNSGCEAGIGEAEYWTNTGRVGRWRDLWNRRSASGRPRRRLPANARARDSPVRMARLATGHSGSRWPFVPAGRRDEVSGR